MCGFAGFIDDSATVPAVLPERAATLQRMGRQLARRGPDEETLHDDGTLAFVFRRLSIVDVDGGSQPIWSCDRSTFVAVNGEIYNHASLRAGLAPKHEFRTRSDAEVVVHLYEEKGARALDDLLGMFAIVIWDARNKKLFLARDRFGIKPLFYCETGDGILFGSELKALLAHPRCPRQPRWADVEPTLMGVTRPRDLSATFLHGVRQLPGGHAAEWACGRLSVHRYWRLGDTPADQADTGRTAESYVDEYCERFVESVGMHLMSDVPVGLFLSGGLDSAMIAAAASQSTRDLTCFNAMLETVAASGDAANAAGVADHFGLPFHRVLYDDDFADQLEFSLESFEYLVWMLDSPRFLLQALVKHELHRYAKTVCPGLKVILLGQGADEFSGGYSDINHEGRGWDDYLARLARQVGVPPSFASIAADPGEARPAHGVDWWKRERELRLGTLELFVLWHEDRTSAGQGVEARVPFLDHRLVELLGSVPRRLHGELFFGKQFMHRVADKLLPPVFAARPKMGYLRAQRMDPIHRIQVRILERTLPAFLEKYATAGGLFDADKMQKIAARIPFGGRAGLEATQLLLSGMAMAIFDRLCDDLGRGVEPTGIDPPSPLRAVAEPPWPAGPGDEPPPTVDDVARLEADVRPCVVFEGTERALLLRRGRGTEPLPFSETPPWLAKLVLRLGEVPRGESARALAAAVGTSPKEALNALSILRRRGFVQFVAAGAPDAEP